MIRILGYVFAMVFAVVLTTPVLTFGAAPSWGTSEPDGVYCEVNEVKLFAQSAEDCEKAGGSVTHTVTTIVEPAGDNPNEEPEIQRTKDKQPKAP